MRTSPESSNTPAEEEGEKVGPLPPVLKETAVTSFLVGGAKEDHNN